MFGPILNPEAEHRPPGQCGHRAPSHPTSAPFLSSPRPLGQPGMGAGGAGCTRARLRPISHPQHFAGSRRPSWREGRDTGARALGGSNICGERPCIQQRTMHPRGEGGGRRAPTRGLMRRRSCVTGGGNHPSKEDRASWGSTQDGADVLSRRLGCTVLHWRAVLCAGGQAAPRGRGGVKVLGCWKGEHGRRPASSCPALTRALLGRLQQGREPQQPRVHRPPPAPPRPCPSPCAQLSRGGFRRRPDCGRHFGPSR